MHVDLPLKNPSFEVQTSSLGIQLFNSTRRILTSQKLNIGTLRIFPNKLKSVSLRGIKDEVLGVKQRKWLLIRFTLTNPINQGSLIQIEIPKKIQILNKFFLGQTQSVVLDKGFEQAFLSNMLEIRWV